MKKNLAPAGLRTQDHKATGSMHTKGAKCQLISLPLLKRKNVLGWFNSQLVPENYSELKFSLS